MASYNILCVIPQYDGCSNEYQSGSICLSQTGVLHYLVNLQNVSEKDCTKLQLCLSTPPSQHAVHFYNSYVLCGDSAPLPCVIYKYRNLTDCTLERKAV